MTDKQIIIDDVDVKDCIAYAKSQTVYLGNTAYNQAENICMVKNQPCKFFDCQFKEMARELKRKEQECEELKNFHINLVGVKKCEIKELVKYKQALTEIKEILLFHKEELEECLYNDIDGKILEKISEVLDED